MPHCLTSLRKLISINLIEHPNLRKHTHFPKCYIDMSMTFLILSLVETHNQCFLRTIKSSIVGLPWNFRFHVTKLDADVKEKIDALFFGSLYKIKICLT